jgi:hypothetical protein
LSLKEGDMRKLWLGVLIVLLLLAAPLLALAQDDGGVRLPEPAIEVDQGIGLLEYLIGVSVVVMIIVEQLKPMVFDPIRERFGDQERQVAIYAARTGLGLLAVIVYGGAAVMTEQLPALADVHEAVVIVTGGLLVAAGAEVLHPLLDILYVLRTRVARPGDPGGVELEIIDAVDGVAPISQVVIHANSRAEGEAAADAFRAELKTRSGQSKDVFG